MSLGPLVLWVAISVCVGCKSDSNKPRPTPTEPPRPIPTEPPRPSSSRAQVPPPADVANPPSDAQRTARGVSYKVLVKGAGTEHPSPTSRVKAHYTGWTTDGRMFDSSTGRQPVTFPLTRVIPGWTDGLQTMVVGDKTRFWIPEELAYQGRAGRPAGTLVFDVELLEILPPEPGPVSIASEHAPVSAPLAGSGQRRLPNGKPIPSPHRFPTGVEIPRMQIPPDAATPSP